jgi:hypothetical protein
MQSRATLGLLAALILPPALAAADETLPSYATARETIEGTIVSNDSKYALTLADVRGFADSVTLRPGTLLEPDGVVLTPGRLVRIIGRADGKTFDADEIDADVSDPDAYDYATGDADDAAGAPAYVPGFAYAPSYGIWTGVWYGARYRQPPVPAWPAPPRGRPPAPRPHPPGPPAPRPVIPVHTPADPPRRR